MIALIGIVYADRLVNATPELQGIGTGTSMNVQGTVTETDSGAWSINAGGIPLSGDSSIVENYPGWASSYWGSYDNFLQNSWYPDVAAFPGITLRDELNYYIDNPSLFDPSVPIWAQDLLNYLQNHGSSLTPPLQDQEVQITTGYNDVFSGVSGEQNFVKSMAISTANKISDQSNIKANTNIQFIAIDTGRATRTEDLLLDGAAMPINTATAILCPFATANSNMIPAYCNIVQAGSAFDTTLTSTVTNANDRFVGTDSTFPVVMNYNIAAKGITLSDGTSSPMIGSASAFLKVHVQEARSVDTIREPNIPGTPDLTVTLPPIKSEDLVYSETSTASGLISSFSKSMSYQSGFNLI